MSRNDQDAAAPNDRWAEPQTNAELAAQLDELPMFRQPTQLAGRAKSGFSPLEFFSLSHVPREQMAEVDDALWLTGEPCPRVSPEGISVGGRMFYDVELQPYVDTRLDTAPPNLRIRYDRALLARGVLGEVRVYRLEPDKSYREVCRCKPRDQVSAEIDMNGVMRRYGQYVEVLRAKISNAEGELFDRSHGEVALTKFRDDQAARERRRRSDKPKARVAEPITHKDRKEREREEAERQANALANRVAGSKRADVEKPDVENPNVEKTGDAPGSTPLAGGSAAPEPSDGGPARTVVPVAPPNAEPELVTDSLALRLGGTIGIAPPSDDE